MSDQVQNTFKEFKVISADSAFQIGASITAMLHSGWRMHGQLGCIQKAEGVLEYYQCMICVETTVIPATVPAEEAPAPLAAAVEAPVEEEALV